MSPASWLLLVLALCLAFGCAAFLVPRGPIGTVMPEDMPEHVGRHRVDEGSTVPLAESRLRHIRR